MCLPAILKVFGINYDYLFNVVVVAKSPTVSLETQVKKTAGHEVHLTNLPAGVAVT